MANQLRKIRTILYHLKREYGQSMDLYTRDSSAADLATGVKTVSKTVYPIKRAIILPTMLTARVHYNISYIAGVGKNFAYGGQYTLGQVAAIVDRRDVPKNLELKLDTTFAVYNNKRWEAKTIDLLEHGLAWLITLREVEGTQLSQIIVAKAYNRFLPTQQAAKT